MISMSSNELNLLIFRYLQEAGFSHSASALENEAGISRSTRDVNMVPPGALVTFVQKGTQHLEREANVNYNDADIDDGLSFLQPLDLIIKDAYELQEIVKEKKESVQKTRHGEKEKGNDVSQSKLDREHARERKKEHEQENSREREHVHEREKEQETEREREREIESERDQAREREKEHDRERVRGKQQMEKGEQVKEGGREKGKGIEKLHADLADARLDGNKMKIEPEKDIAKPQPMDVEAVDFSLNSTATICIVPDSDVAVLNGHTSEIVQVVPGILLPNNISCEDLTIYIDALHNEMYQLVPPTEVYVCAWSPSGPLLASGAGDSTARICTINEGPCNSNMQGVLQDSAELKHSNGGIPSENVSALDWNIEGTLLATGCCDGHTRIWSRDGELVNTLDKHEGPIVSLQWNKKGDYLLSGSIDKTAIVWDIETGQWKQQFEFHSAPLLDVDWRNNVSFATCSADTMIYVCKVGDNRPLKTFSGHQGDVNAVKWDPTGHLLASCSDDSTAKIWSMKQNTCLHDLKEHTKAIYTIKWSPSGPGTNILNRQLLLASASFDATIKLWDVESGSLIYSLNGHRRPVYAIAFSPNGDYIASGSLDRCVNVWSVKDARIVKTYTGNGGIFDICWNKEGYKIAACFASNEVCVMDFRM